MTEKKDSILAPKEALSKALDYFLEAFPKENIDVGSVSLESLALSDNKKEWVMSLSFQKKRQVTQESSSLEVLFGEKPKKEIRTIRITADKGSFIAIESPNINLKTS